MNNTGKKFGGRKKGTPNKATAELREQVQTFLESNWNDIQTTYNGLEGKDKLNFIDKMLKYCLPTLQATSLEVEPISLDGLSREQVDSLFDRIINS